MNLTDLLIIAIVATFILDGLKKSLLWEFFDLLSFLCAFLISLRFYNLAASTLSQFIVIPHSFSKALGFILVWNVVEIFLFLISRRVFPNTQIPNTAIGKLLSVLPSFLKGLVFVAIILIVIVTFPVQPLIKDNINRSAIGSYILARSYQIEGPLKNIFGDAASDTLNFLTVKPEEKEAVKLGFNNDSFNFNLTLETSMIHLINQERSKQGLNLLIYDSKLQEVARLHSADMFKRGYFSHYNPEGESVANRVNNKNIVYSVIGENLAYAPTLQAAHRGLMNSPGHRANILSKDYNKVGIGIADSPEYGLMVTQNFSN